MRLIDPRRWSLAVVFPLALTLIVTAVGFTIGAAMILQDRDQFRTSLNDKALLFARVVATSVPEAVMRKDTWALYKILRRLTSGPGGEVRDPALISAMILDREGRVLAHLDPAGHRLGLPLTVGEDAERQLLAGALRARAAWVVEGGRGNAKFVDAAVPVRAGNKRVAVVRVRLTMAEFHEHVWSAALTVIGLTVVLVVVGSALGVVVSRRLVRPLVRLTQAMDSVGRERTGSLVPVGIGGGGEIGQLTATFNRMARELADKKRMEEQIAIDQKLLALGRVAAGVAHEVNNPLAGMLNCFDTLKMHPDKPELVRRYLPMLEAGLNRIHGIVKALLVEVRIEGVCDPCGPECLDELEVLAEADIGERDLALRWENSLPPDTRINRAPIQQIVFNLLKNAIQASADGGTVTFRASAQREDVLLEVIDDGAGISADDRDRLFDPFFTTRSTGTGLGLWIVYRLVESMGGVIRVESEPGNGTTFSVQVPAEVEDAVKWAS